mmetsp:Transcript_99780/g.307842  ORF Transcript_99780/g.307842 Transcript_99780/m.307842 type:complete len:212 (-) Transcript_99780:320-955(-)
MGVRGSALALTDLEGVRVGARPPDHGEVSRLVVLDPQPHAETLCSRGDSAGEEEGGGDALRPGTVHRNPELASARGNRSLDLCRQQDDRALEHGRGLRAEPADPCRGAARAPGARADLLAKVDRVEVRAVERLGKGLGTGVAADELAGPAHALRWQVAAPSPAPANKPGIEEGVDQRAQSLPSQLHALGARCNLGGISPPTQNGLRCDRSC